MPFRQINIVFWLHYATTVFYYELPLRLFVSDDLCIAHQQLIAALEELIG